PVISAVNTTSMTATWTTLSNTTGYEVDASTAANFTGTLTSSITPNTSLATLATPATLFPNTTYYLRVGALYNGATVYANTAPASTSTLANLVSAAQDYKVFATSVTVNWQALAAAPSSSTAEGYLVLASSTGFDGTGTIYSSST